MGHHAAHTNVSSDDSSCFEASPKHDSLSERTPLITTTSFSDNGDEEINLGTTQKTRASHKIIFLLAALIILATSGDQMMDSPQTRILESIICYRYYEVADPSKIALGRDRVGPGAVGGVDELWCKVDAVQAELSTLRGYQQFLDGFPSLLLAFPLGWAADRFGRKPILLLSILSFVFRAAYIQFICWFWQAFDVRWTLLSSLHGLISGSGPCLSALFFVIISDVVAPEERSAFFLRIGAANMISNFAIPPIAAWLMHYNPWIPNFFGTAVLTASMFLAHLIPETLDWRHPHATPSSSHPPSPTTETLPSTPDPSSSAIIFLNSPVRLFQAAKSATTVLWSDWRVPVLITTYLLHLLLSVATVQTLLLYISKRYLYTLSQATLVLTIRSLVNFVFLFLLLPWIAKLMTQKFGLSPQRKDLYLARASLILTAIGWTMTGLSPNIALVAISIIISSLGYGWPLLLRSFLASLVPTHHLARVYAIISVLDTLGSMLAGPLLASLFNQGLKLGGMGIGLPFYFVGFVSAITTGVVFVVGLRKGEEADALDMDDEEGRI